MTTDISPAPPDGLGDAGRALWADAIAGLVFEGHELRVLADACSIADVIAGLDAAVATDGVIVVSRLGERRPNPAAVEARQQRVALARLLALLKIPARDEQPAAAASGPMSRTESARIAANARWARARDGA